jgi:BirA family transcriptional regulator, biotin operon repressor / biotin---[acetyl-CoA-carboxylase] ligase
MAGMTAALGKPRLHLRRTGSTNERARSLAIAGAPHGTLVTAAEQTEGRGRQGRSWAAPPGSSLLASLVLRSPALLLSLRAAVAVCDAIDEGALVKWPNDVVLARGTANTRRGDLAKLGGILVEARPQEGWAVLGVGLNVAVRLEDLPEAVRADAATLGRPKSAIEPLLERLLGALERRLAEPPEVLLEDYRALDALRGHTIAWAAGEGRADGIDGQGKLLVELAGGGRTALDAGEVHLRA